MMLCFVFEVDRETLHERLELLGLQSRKEIIISVRSLQDQCSYPREANGY